MKTALKAKLSLLEAVTPVRGGGFLFFCRILFVGCLLLSALRAQAATYYVSPSGNDTNSGVSLTLAKKTIQAAINVAVANDTVLVADGTYAPITINKAITVRSVNGSQATIIDGGGVTRCANMESGAVLDGFRVTNGYSNYGGGVYAYNSTLRNCTITGNRAFFSAGGIHADSSTVENCMVIGNILPTNFYSYSCAGGIYAYNSIVRNCNISLHTAIYGGGIYTYYSIIENCTITGNKVFSGPGDYYCRQGGGVLAFYSVLRNCNISGNMADYKGGGIYSYSCILENCTITENTIPMNYNYYNSYAAGVYAYYSTVRNCNISGNTSIFRVGGIYSRSGILENCTITENKAYEGSGGVWTYNGPVRNCIISGNSAARAAGVDSYVSSVENCIISENTAERNGGGVFLNGNNIVKNCIIRKNIAYLNGGGAMVQGGTIEDCIIEENVSYGSTWTTPSYDCGGGVFIQSGVVRNCAINRNIAYWDGGGAFLVGGTLENCTLEGNQAYSFGGGISIVGGTARNCLLTGNKATDMGGGVWAMGGSVENCTIVRNTVLSDNGSLGVGGGVFVQGGTVRNCIAYYNQDTDVVGPISYSCLGVSTGGVGNITNEPRFISTGAGYGLNNVPGNYRLQKTSPCINIAANQSWMAISVDLDGRPRILGGIVDMGAYEYSDRVTIKCSPAILSNRCVYGANAASQLVAIWNLEEKAMEYALAPNVNWLTIVPTNGASDGGVNLVSANYAVSSFTPGSYAGTISITSPQAWNSPQTVQVKLIVDKLSQTITFPAIPDQTVTSRVGLVATASSGLPVSFVVASGPGIISDGTNLSFTAAGTVQVVASQAGDVIWQPAPSVTNTAVVMSLPGGVVQFAVTSVEINEATGLATLTVTRTGGSFGPASVDYVSANGTAAGGLDYETVQGTLFWADGDTSSKTISVHIMDDSLDESDEAFTVTLSNARGASLGPASVATVTIIDNDEPPSEDLVDLEISNFKFLPVNLWAGDYPAMISLDLLNEGPADLVVPETKLEITFYLSSNTTFGDGDDLAIGTKTEEITLSAGSQTTLRYPGRAHNQDVTIPEGLSGDFYVFANVKLVSQSGLLDPDGAVAMREGPIRVRIHPSGGGDSSDDGNDPSDEDDSGGSGVSPWHSVVNDYDADGLSDMMEYDEPRGEWVIQFSASGASARFIFGGPEHEAVPGDYDGDVKTDPAVHERHGASWQIMLSGLGYETVSFDFGAKGETKGAVGDYNGDELADPGLYEEKTGRWYVFLQDKQGNFEIASTVFGGLSYIPVVGDYDGDSRVDPALYEEATGNWLVMLSGQGYGVVSAIFGGPGQSPVVGDYDGDGKADPMLSTGSEWVGLMSGSGYALKHFSNLVGTPVPGDFDGDGTADPAVISTPGEWSFLSSLSAYVRQGPYALRP